MLNDTCGAGGHIHPSILVGWAFAIAASTFCPMFLLGVWWTGLTARGAAVGMLVGAFIATAPILTGLALGDAQMSTVGATLAQPAPVAGPSGRHKPPRGRVLIGHD